MEELSKEQIVEWELKAPTAVLYLYTPLCGTCQMASKMLAVVEELLPSLPWCKANLNYFPHISERWEVESVPCLLVIRDGKVEQKLYAFHSVPYLFETLKPF